MAPARPAAAGLRLAQVIAGAPQGGIESFYERLTLALADSGHPTLAAIRREPGRAERLRHGHIELHELRFGSIIDLPTRFRLGRLLRAYRPEVVIGWANRANAFLPMGPWVRVGRPGGYYKLKYYRGCDHLAYTTRDLVQWAVRQGWPADRAHLLPNFVEDGLGTAPVPRSELGVPEGVPLALAMGRLHRNKDFATLLRALARVPDAHLLLAGAGPEEPALRQEAESLGLTPRLRFLGWRTDGAALRATADLFVISSSHEPFGSIVPEAWASRLPLVSTRAQGPLEVIRDGEDALLVPIGDADMLADAIRSVIRAPGEAARLAANGRRRFETEYAKDVVVGIWDDFLQRIAR